LVATLVLGTKNVFHGPPLVVFDADGGRAPWFRLVSSHHPNRPHSIQTLFKRLTFSKKMVVHGVINANRNLELSEEPVEAPLAQVESVPYEIVKGAMAVARS
jgi:hypothetical protein